MPARRKAAAVTAVGLVPLALTALAAWPAAAHGSMSTPVGRGAQCYAEGPESPRSQACRAAVAAGGTQALYDWNGVRVGDAAGRHRELIADGRLCSAGNAEFKGLDLARADWPATSVRGGPYTFRYRVTAPHKGAFTVYITRPGYDPTRPPAWSDLDLGHPVATAVDPAPAGGFATFSGTLPERSGRQLLYTIWQRSDSPEAFYSCSDVTFATAGGNGAAGGGSAPAAPAPAASAPSERQIADGAGRSTVGHHGHGYDDAATATDRDAGASATAEPPVTRRSGAKPSAAGGSSSGSTGPKAAAAGPAPGRSLARTGGDGRAPYLAVGGAAVLALGAGLLFASVRRRAAGGHGR
ncbi:lytic polysaccharide monooxygenase [Streptomyces sp. NPDC021608]|uniref:lytic polysaccharide monooxygenase n=1 Tax=Streptomyces sp. NPDC021608 TaxID=3154903 RepID=UPI0033CD8955